MAFWNKQSSMSPDELLKALTQEIATYMNSIKISSQPVLKFFYNDRGLLEGLFVQHTTDPVILALKRQSQETYLLVAGMHAFGAGAYITITGGKWGKSVDKFTAADISAIAHAFEATDSFELALNELMIPVTSRNKLVLDSIIQKAAAKAKELTGSAVIEHQNLRVYMQVLFNAGITMALRE
jgi:hypothetical protein